jgi:hypothetical protein
MALVHHAQRRIMLLHRPDQADTAFDLAVVEHNLRLPTSRSSPTARSTSSPDCCCRSGSACRTSRRGWSRIVPPSISAAKACSGVSEVAPCEAALAAQAGDRVMSAHRLELTGFTEAMRDRLRAYGLFSEIISWNLGEAGQLQPMGAHDAGAAKLETLGEVEDRAALHQRGEGSTSSPDCCCRSGSACRTSRRGCIDSRPTRASASCSSRWALMTRARRSWRPSARSRIVPPSISAAKACSGVSEVPGVLRQHDPHRRRIAAADLEAPAERVDAGVSTPCAAAHNAAPSAGSGRHGVRSRRRRA